MNLHRLGQAGGLVIPVRFPDGAGLRWQLCRTAALVFSASLVFLWPEAAHSYIGPGAGFAVLGSFLVVLAALLLAGVVLFTWPLRFLLRYRRQARAYAKSHTDRLVILGLDGMDPELAESMMAAGDLPHLAGLREAGTYGRLGTTCPAMSPVAWSSFMTGTCPGRHGIFDFLRRDPRTYLPDVSSAQISSGRRQIRLGPIRIGWARPSVRSLRRSRPFWAILGENGVHATVLRVPITFPPEPFRGLLLSGMCVPDLRGTQGSFTFFTTGMDASRKHTGGERLPLEIAGGVLKGSLPGPPSSGGEGDGRPAEVAFRLTPRGDSGARLNIGDQQVELEQGRFSEWVPVTFRVGRGARASGICQFYLRQLTPEVELYVSPINIDPERPALPISHPAVYSVYLAKRLGRFATLGLAEDTWALNEGVLGEEAFLEQCELFFQERKRMFFNALRNTRRGCVVCVFDTTDRVQHMFWRNQGQEEDAGSEDSSVGDPVREAYRQADDLVGKVVSELGRRDTLVVMSDHGFGAFGRGVNVNAWLRDRGYLALKPGATGEGEWLTEVDWDRTRAYALGLAGIYLNVRGREAKGIVAREEMGALKRELMEGLGGLRDEDKGSIAIDRVYDNAEVNPGPYSDTGPDLLVGYAPGYRASWSAAQGKAAGAVVEDNLRHWSGDHCVDPRHVSGVLFCNRPLSNGDASIIDVAPTVLELFGVERPGYMEGKSLVLHGEDGKESPGA